MAVISEWLMIISIVLFFILSLKDTGHGMTCEFKRFIMRYIENQKETRKEIHELTNQVKELVNVLKEK